MCNFFFSFVGFLCFYLIPDFVGVLGVNRDLRGTKMFWSEIVGPWINLSKGDTSES